MTERERETNERWNERARAGECLVRSVEMRSGVKPMGLPLVLRISFSSPSNPGCHSPGALGKHKGSVSLSSCTCCHLLFWCGVHTVRLLPHISETSCRSAELGALQTIGLQTLAVKIHRWFNACAALFSKTFHKQILTYQSSYMDLNWLILQKHNTLNNGGLVQSMVG